ncbi:hypothetical protein BGW36DRAFT_433197 [Talaromyces proteolyticus]|uniref:Condensation domain-containing protein n=1 Tax=Talaromyces proteolyticus TaxID=1131652 RepID=A0AAD4KIP9_9EURO|nr:uncharacterized protein BGW36DRAFT_433197 [Talaromyces proteolyticus]KAH8690245.1 hypothetical protein BGW36DRAFT_433197 [Talaromyces proteolyticus]
MKGSVSEHPAVFDSEWKVVNSNTSMVRPLRGVELMIQSSERFCNGNFQLTLAASLETTLTCEQLTRRHQAAWWRTRHMRPVVGVVFGLDYAAFEVHGTVDAAKQWATQTCRVASNTTVADVALARSRQPLESPTMTLVVNPIRGARGCVLNVSHTLISQEGFRILQEFLTQLARPDSELGINTVFSPETVLDVQLRLPQSLSHAYSLLHQPTPQELRDAFQIYQRVQMHWARSTIGIPLHRDWQKRPSHIYTKVVQFEPYEASAALKCLKKWGITLTTAFFACITSAIANTYDAGNEDGAHLLYSANARRWLPTNGHGVLVTMGILPAGMWIDASKVDIRAKDQPGLMRLARAIEQAQQEDLVSPHIIAVYDQIAPALAKAIGEQPQSTSSPIGRPTLTSQGYFDDDVNRLPGPGRDQIRMTDISSGGRNTDPNVCFALYSFRDELRCNLMFDGRFFVQDEVMQLAYTVSGLFRRLTTEELEFPKL